MIVARNNQRERLRRLPRVLIHSIGPRIQRPVENRNFLLSTFYFRLSSASLAEEHRVHRLEHDHRVEFEGVMPDVIKIVFQFFDRILIALAIGIIYLRPARDAGFYQVAEMIERDLLLVALGALDPLRPRSDQAHVPAKHVPKLWQLVEPEFPEPPSHLRDP